MIKARARGNCKYFLDGYAGYAVKNIRKIRNDSKMTQEEVVTWLQLSGIDISRSIYSQIECGTYNIRASELIALSKLFETDINSFFVGL